jgi:hypothetical protein
MQPSANKKHKDQRARDGDNFDGHQWKLVLLIDDDALVENGGHRARWPQPGCPYLLAYH